MKHSILFIFLACTAQMQSSQPILSLTPQQVNPLPNQNISTGHTTRDTAASKPENYVDYPNQQAIIRQEAKNVGANLLGDFESEVFPH